MSAQLIGVLDYCLIMQCAIILQTAKASWHDKKTLKQDNKILVQ